MLKAQLLQLKPLRLRCCFVDASEVEKNALEPGPPKEKKAEVAGEILAYLSDNPESQDTLEGIVEWWLLEQKIKNQTAEVKEALSELLNKGLIIEEKFSDSRPHYRVNREKINEVRAFLRRESSPETNSS